MTHNAGMKREIAVIAQRTAALISRYRLSLSFFILLAMLIEWSRHWRPHSLFSLLDWEHPAGLVLLVAGAALRSWAAGVIRKHEDLTSEGPYALVRHPLYLGSFLMAVGVVEILEDRIALAMVLTMIPTIYASVIQREERALAERFGLAWVRYAERTAVLIPRLPTQIAWGEWHWERWRCNREWRILLRTIVLLVALEAWNAGAQGG